MGLYCKSHAGFSALGFECSSFPCGSLVLLLDIERYIKLMNEQICRRR